MGSTDNDGAVLMMGGSTDNNGAALTMGSTDDGAALMMGNTMAQHWRWTALTTMGQH